MDEIYKSILGRIIGVGGIILFIHMIKIIRGSPRAFLELFDTDTEAREYSKLYFRSINSFVAPAIFVLIFCAGTGLVSSSQKTKIGMDNEWSFMVIGALCIGLSMYLYHIVANYFMSRFLSKKGFPLPNDSPSK